MLHAEQAPLGMDEWHGLVRINTLRTCSRRKRYYDHASRVLIGILGSTGAVLQGANVANTVGTSLVSGVTLTLIAATILLLSQRLLS